MDSGAGKKKVIVTVAVLVAIALLVFGATALNTPEPTEQAGTSQSSQTSDDTNDSDATANDTASSDEYQNGRYTKTVNYSSPGGRESITFNVTLENGVITASSAEAGATNREAREYQSDFIDAYESTVIGKNIDEVSVSRIAGASLTTGGFRDALEQIRDEAAR